MNPASAGRDPETGHRIKGSNDDYVEGVANMNRSRAVLNLKRTGLAAAMSLLLVSGTARAGCCDDFFSCLGAVATGGLSCAVEALTSVAANAALRPQINQFQSMIANGRNQVAQSMKEREVRSQETGKQVADSMRDSIRRLEQDVVRARYLSSPQTQALLPGPAGLARTGNVAAPASPAAGAPAASVRVGKQSASPSAPSPSPGGVSILHDPLVDAPRLKRVLDFALTKVQSLERQARQVHGQHRDGIVRAPALAKGDSRELTALYESTVVIGLDRLIKRLLDFINHPLDPTKMAQLITAVVEGARSVLNNEGARFEARDRQLLDTLNARLRVLEEAAANANGHLELGDKIVAQMEKTAKRPTISQVKALEAITGMPHKATRPRPAEAGGDTTRRALAPATAISAMRANLVSMTAAPSLGRQPPGPPPHVSAMMPGYRARVEGELARRLGAPGGGQQNLAALRAEVQRRYAGDPATRDAVLRYLDQQAPRFILAAPAAPAGTTIRLPPKGAIRK